MHIHANIKASLQGGRLFHCFAKCTLIKNIKLISKKEMGYPAGKIDFKDKTNKPWS